MNITINLPVKNEKQRKQLEKILYLVGYNFLQETPPIDNFFLKAQEENLSQIWEDESLDVYNKFLKWNTQSDK